MPLSGKKEENEDDLVYTIIDDVVFAITDRGAREHNEDRYLALRLPAAYLLAVADGLGGHNAGEVASKIAVDTLEEVFKREYEETMSLSSVASLLRKAHELAHSRIASEATGEREGMGTTLVSAFIRGRKAVIANTGDSRAYLIRNGSIVARTRDHSIVQDLLDMGEITPEEARMHPMRNVVTKALGIEFGVDIYEWRIEWGDVLLLSSDGLHDYVEEGEIVKIASRFRTPLEIGRELMIAALKVTKDNVTVVVYREY